LTAAKSFLRLALSVGQIRPRVINVDGHTAYASAIEELSKRVNWADTANLDHHAAGTTSSSRITVL
jgi:transposase-like protein